RFVGGAAIGRVVVALFGLSDALRRAPTVARVRSGLLDDSSVQRHRTCAVPASPFLVSAGHECGQIRRILAKYLLVEARGFTRIVASLRDLGQPGESLRVAWLFREHCVIQSFCRRELSAF